MSYKNFITDYDSLKSIFYKGYNNLLEYTKNYNIKYLLDYIKTLINTIFNDVLNIINITKLFN